MPMLRWEFLDGTNQLLIQFHGGLEACWNPLEFPHDWLGQFNRQGGLIIALYSVSLVRDFPVHDGIVLCLYS